MNATYKWCWKEVSEHKREPPQLREVLESVQQVEETHWYLRGRKAWWQSDLQEAERCYRRGQKEQSCPLCMWMISAMQSSNMAERQYDGETADLVLKSYELGYEGASVSAGLEYVRRQQYGKAAQALPDDWQDRTKILVEHAYDCTPWGAWSVGARQRTVMRPVRLAQREAMLLCKRRGVPHGVALLIAEYVCTQPWKRENR